MRRVGDWILIAAATVAGGALADRVGVPSGYLFAAMLVGVAYALIAPGRMLMPDGLFRVGQAVTGVALGTFLEASTLTGLGWRWISVVLVSAATLAVTIFAGLLLARTGRIDRPTASLGMIAGGASGIIAMADELGADARLVGFMQYLRVLVITLITPVLVPLAFGVDPVAGGNVDVPLLGTPGGWVLVAGAAIAGAALGARLRLPAPMLFGPLLLTSVLSLSGLSGDTDVPRLASETAFSVIGLWIGLSFDRDTLVQIRRLMLPVAIAIAGLLLACLALGWVLTLTADVTLLDGYLATTPGGLYAVLPIAYGSGADSTFVLAVQSLRLFAMVLAAPLIVRWLLRERFAHGPG